MDEYKLKPGKIGEKVIGAYKKVENAVVGGYKKVEGAFVDAFLEKVPPEEDAASEDTVSDGEEQKQETAVQK